MSNAGVSRAKTTGEHKFVNARARAFHPQATQQRILCTTEDLHRCLYKRNEVVFVSKEDFRTSLQQKEEVRSYWCKGCHQERTEQCQLHAPHQTLKITTTVNNNNKTNNNARLPNAVESFPNEVGLCISSIPGAGYGVCAKQTIPLGTWIGPYEGELVRPEEVLLGADASYMWEIFHEGKLLYYIDGRDESKSSWMRYIRCARHPHEQNMFAFQYCGNIYYRAFKDIPAKTELLVWYDDKYPQYMGIPLEIYEASPGKAVDPRQQPDMVVVVPRDVSNPATSHSYRPPPRPLTDHLQPNLHLTQQRPLPPSRVQSRDQSRAKRTLTQSVSLGSENLHQPITTQAYKRVRRVSWANDSAPLPINSQVIDSSTEDARFARDTQAATARSGVARNIQTNGHHDNTPLKELCDDRSKKPLTTAEERQPRSGDEEGSSSDGSDASFFNCGQCGKSFAQRSVLQIHVCPNMPHKPYHCGHCEQSFDNPNELRTHAVIHVGEKPFKCGYCSRSFAGATTLHNHVRTHTGEKPFTCERCGKNFSQASQLHKHEGIPGDCVPYNNLPD